MVDPPFFLAELSAPLRPGGQTNQFLHFLLLLFQGAVKLIRLNLILS